MPHETLGRTSASTEGNLLTRGVSFGREAMVAGRTTLDTMILVGSAAAVLAVATLAKGDKEPKGREDEQKIEKEARRAAEVGQAEKKEHHPRGVEPTIENPRN